MVSALTMHPSAFSLPLMLELDETELLLPELDELLPVLDEDVLLADEGFSTEEELFTAAVVSFVAVESFTAVESPVAELSLTGVAVSCEAVSVMSVSEELLGVVMSDESESPQAAKNARDKTIEAI